MKNETKSVRGVIVSSLHGYLKERYSNIPRLAITMDCTGRYADIVLYVHRTDDTWHTIALNISDHSYGVRGKVVSDQWEGWRIEEDMAQPLRYAPLREDVNRMHRVRDVIAADEAVRWQDVSAFVLFPVHHGSMVDKGWYGNMQLASVGALPFVVCDNCNVDLCIICEELCGMVF